MIENISIVFLKFGVNLEDYQSSGNFRKHGPLFNKWLPDGEEDALLLNIDDLEDFIVILKLWFERRGSVRKDQIVFDYEKREVSTEIMSSQESLDAGPLLGSIELSGLSVEQLNLLYDDKVGDNCYEKIGKMIVNKIIYPNVNKLLNIIRVNYGQYWVAPLEKWDSRNQSLGSYCQNIELKWSLDRKIWKPFIPNNPEEYLTLVLRDKSEEETLLLTKNDWKDILKLGKTGYDPTLAAECLARTDELLNRGNLKYALIEGVTAIEVALDEVIRSKLEYNYHSKGEHIRIFSNLELTSRLKMVVTFIDKIAPDDMELTLKAINTRNKIVHEGLSPGDEVKNEINALQRTIAILLKEQKFKYISDFNNKTDFIGGQND